MIIDTNIPVQRRQGFFYRMIRAILRTQIGKHVAFTTGLRGFNRVGTRLIKFVRKYDGGKLRWNEMILGHLDNDVIPEGEKWVYKKPGILQFVYNARVDVGAKLQAYLMSNSNLGSLTSPSFPIYIALSTSSLTAAKGDTTLSGETSATGLARALATIQNFVAPSTLDGAASYDLYKQFTNTSGGTVTVQSSAIFDASSTGNMFAEANLSASASMANNDILQLTWTINI